MTATIGSLCSGYGGLDLAVEQFYRARTAWFCEIDPKAASVFAAHWPGVPNLRDVKLTHFGRVPRVDILTAGYPCQPFSPAGRRNGVDDPRHLWPYIAQAVRRIRPRHVVLENVAGHRSLGFDIVLGSLAALGYDVRWTSLRAADIGAPHGRERIFIVATDTSNGTSHREWSRKESRQGDATAAYPTHLGHERRRESRDGRTGSADRGGPVTHADGSGSQGSEPATGRHLPARGVASYTDRDALREQPVTEPRRSSKTVAGLAVRRPTAADAAGNGWNGRAEAAARGRADRDGSRSEPARPVQWGQYEPAIRRWERLTRLAPAPTEAGPKGGQRLSPRFVEWMQGLPAGWVCDVPGLSRNDMLRILGNGVVPQQALEAQRRLATIEPSEAVA